MRTDNIDLVIFDCDGVLIDSEVLSMQAWNSVLANYDIALTKQYFIENFLGKSMEHVRSKIEEDFALSLTPSLEGEFHTLLFHAFERHLTATSGIIDVLSSLRVPFCVATSSSPERTEKALKSTGLFTYFNDRIFTRSLVSRGKPAPDLFLYAANALNCSPRTCLVIEDSQPGLAGAKAAGMRYLHYTGGTHIRNLVEHHEHTIASWDGFTTRFPDLFDTRKKHE